ncbi:dimethylsulfonioproprionate lyase family protein [Shimia thalassica]|uniref:dimethylsulfonioproprionate lyase family protein n=1 Tax=Shimia thalassica TaxID=1715693 RepID=UPI002734954C|nr:dimethylsulfonioproprionate lyase family protein [Shimia thalassica]
MQNSTVFDETVFLLGHPIQHRRHAHVSATLARHGDDMTGMYSALASARSVCNWHPDMRAFTDWPIEIPETDTPPLKVPAVSQVETLTCPDAELTRPLVQSIKEAANEGHWIQTYTEEQVGQHFLANYGYFELVGPKGHFHSNHLRAFVAYWGAGLKYDWHHHEAEEIYLCLAGRATFYAEGRDPVKVCPGEAVFHASHQSHAMVTTDQPILTLVLWRGAGLAGLPRMDNA